MLLPFSQQIYKPISNLNSYSLLSLLFQGTKVHPLSQAFCYLLDYPLTIFPERIIGSLFLYQFLVYRIVPDQPTGKPWNLPQRKTKIHSLPFNPTDSLAINPSLCSLTTKLFERFLYTISFPYILVTL